MVKQSITGVDILFYYFCSRHVKLVNRNVFFSDSRVLHFTVNCHNGI